MSQFQHYLSKIAKSNNPIFTKTYNEPPFKAGKLAGRVISIKDLFDVQGEITTAGSMILNQNAPALCDAPVVANLKAAGAMIIGKTNMSEFAFHGIGTNPHFGDVQNAHSPLHVTGGSSSGAAASVAAGLCEIAIGSDTGGSIRNPAALNGIVGFKPSKQRVSCEGAFPLSYTLDSIGPLARNVRDCIITDEVLSGEEHGEMKPYPLKGLRVALPVGRMIDRASEEVKTAFNNALNLLREAGATIIPVDIEAILERIVTMQGTAPLVTIEAAAIHKSWHVAREKDYHRPVYERIKLGMSVMAVDYINMLQVRKKLINEYKVLMQQFDVMVSPTVLITAPLISDTKVSLEEFFRLNGLCLHNPTIGNILDVCGLSLPCPKVEGLPVGFQLMSVNGDDKKLLRIGLSVEEVFNKQM